MKDYDVVILTDSRYVQPNEKNQYIENVLKEDGLLIEALNNLGLKTIKKDWNDSSRKIVSLYFIFKKMKKNKIK